MSEELHTIDDGKKYLRDNWEEGVDCPCCGQMVKLYDYKLFATSANALQILYRLTKESGEPYHHIRNYAEADKSNKRIRAPHFAELRFWGLIAKPDNTNPKLKSSGMWCITEKGKQFVERRIKVPSRILVFNNIFQGFSDKAINIDIVDALDNNFDYREIAPTRNEFKQLNI